MKYIADILTWSRIVLCLGLMVLAVLDIFGMIELNYVVVFIIAAYSFLSDAFDGICARRWPYPDEESARLFYRKDAHAFDNVGDFLLYNGVVLALCAHDLVWVWFLVGTGVVSLIFRLTVDALVRRRSPKAEAVDVLWGWWYGVTLAVMLVVIAQIAFPMMWLWVVIAGLVLTAILLPSKWDRLTTRPERRIA